MNGYNGWTNYETWNVALWLQNDEFLYEIAKRYSDYSTLKRHLPISTPDGVEYGDESVNIAEIAELLTEM